MHNLTPSDFININHILIYISSLPIPLYIGTKLLDILTKRSNIPQIIKYLMKLAQFFFLTLGTVQFDTIGYIKRALTTKQIILKYDGANYTFVLPEP